MCDSHCDKCCFVLYFFPSFSFLEIVLAEASNVELLADGLSTKLTDLPPPAKDVAIVRRPRSSLHLLIDPCAVS